MNNPILKRALRPVEEAARRHCFAQPPCLDALVTLLCFSPVVFFCSLGELIIPHKWHLRPNYACLETKYLLSDSPPKIMAPGLVANWDIMNNTGLFPTRYDHFK